MLTHDEVIADLEARLERARQAKETAITPFALTVPLTAYRKDIRAALAAADRRQMAGADAFDAGALVDLSAQLTVDPTTGSYTLLSVTDGDQTLLPADGSLLHTLVADPALAEHYPDLADQIEQVRQQLVAGA